MPLWNPNLRDHWPVIARPELTPHHARHRAVGNRTAREYHIEAPADVALLHVPPRRPPREEIGILRLHLAMHVYEAMTDDLLEKRSFLRPLTDAIRLSLFRVHVHIGSGHIEIAAQDKRPS